MVFHGDLSERSIASEARSLLIFLERTSRRDEVLGLHRPLLPSEQSVSVNSEFQDSMLRTELESERESESSLESHSITGKASTLLSKFRLKNSYDSFVSMFSRRAPFDMVLCCCSSNAFVAGHMIVDTILII